MSSHIHATPESGKDFYMQFNDKGKVVMLNLLKFRETADYSGHENIAPAGPISGKEAYQLYINHTLPILEKAGARVIFMGQSNGFLIGPEAEKWDLVLLVEHESVTTFMAFAQNEEYLKGAGHRTAALADSRLLPSNAIQNLT